MVHFGSSCVTAATASSYCCCIAYASSRTYCLGGRMQSLKPYASSRNSVDMLARYRHFPGLAIMFLPHCLMCVILCILTFIPCTLSCKGCVDSKQAAQLAISFIQCTQNNFATSTQREYTVHLPQQSVVITAKHLLQPNRFLYARYSISLQRSIACFSSFKHSSCQVLLTARN